MKSSIEENGKSIKVLVVKEKLESLRGMLDSPPMG
jgi:hypothetical protein